MTDREIITLYRSGEREKAFSEIVSTYSERLYWHVRHLVSSHEDTDDLLQEIFVKVWTALPSYRGDAQLFTWMWRIATNESLNFMRKKNVRASLQFASIEDDDMASRIEDDPYFDGDEAQRYLYEAISQLPDRQKAVFTMRYYDDISYKEMSEILDASVGALKASYHIAYEKVKAYLQERLGEI